MNIIPNSGNEPSTDCGYCDNPDPRDSRRHAVITEQGSAATCGLCAVQLLASPLQVTLMLYTAAVTQ